MYIVIEGIDGAGTTTQTGMLATYLFNKSKDAMVLTTREPTMHTPDGLEIRRRLKQNEPLPLQQWADLFIKDRTYHLERIVQPALNRNIHVISDRNMLSTLAYQSNSEDDMKFLYTKHQYLLQPDILIYLDVPPMVALKRMDHELDLFETQLDRVSKNYVDACTLYNATIIDGTQSLDSVHQEIVRIIENYKKD